MPKDGASAARCSGRAVGGCDGGWITYIFGEMTQKARLSREDEKRFTKAAKKNTVIWHFYFSNKIDKKHNKEGGKNKCLFASRQGRRGRGM